MFRCVEGYFSDSPRSTECTVCPPGSKCPLTDAMPIPCDLGTYTLGGQTQCLQCPLAHSCTTTSSTPQPCPEGWYSADGDPICTPCPPGYFCPTTPPASTPILCSTGYYSDTMASTECTQCPIGENDNNNVVFVSEVG